ncbi:heme A synthase, partial [bacterium]
MSSRFIKYSWAVLGYTLLALMTGAFVRATGSGAGCGSHWPLCNGEIIPRAPRVDTIIEFTHRASSGLTLVLIAILAIWAWRSASSGRLVRRASAAALLFILFEAVIGAWLVRYNLVTTNDSAARAVLIMFHLVNTFFLLASLAL